MADARWRVEACHPRPTAALGVAFGGCHPRRGGAASRHDPASPAAAHAGDRARGHDVPRRDGARRDGAPSRPGAADRPRRRTDARRASSSAGASASSHAGSSRSASARRPGRGPRRHAPGVDARGLRRPRAPARSSCRSTTRTRPRRCRYVLAHSGARAVICEDAAQVAKVDRGPRGLPRARAHDRHERRRPASCRCATWPPRRRGRRRRRRRAPRGRGPRRRGDDRLHVGHDRPAEGLRAHARQLPGHDRACTSAGSS